MNGQVGNVSTARDQVVEVRGLGLGRASEALVRIATDHGYLVAASGPNRFRLARTFRPMWANVCALIFAPLFGSGLFFLLVKKSEACEGIVLEDRSGVRINLTGAVDPALFVALHSTLSDPNSVAPVVPAPTAFAPQQSFTPQQSSTQQQSSPDQQPLASQPVAASHYLPTPRAANPAPASFVAPLEDDRTMTVAQLAAMRTTAAPALQFIDGRTVAVGAGLIIGRSPEADQQMPSAELFSFNDPSLSKTHASFGVTPHGIWVRDHHSTNGTTVKLNGSTTACQPGARVDVPVGAAVVIGEVYVSVVASSR